MHTQLPHTAPPPHTNPHTNGVSPNVSPTEKAVTSRSSPRPARPWARGSPALPQLVTGPSVTQPEQPHRRSRLGARKPEEEREEPPRPKQARGPARHPGGRSTYVPVPLHRRRLPGAFSAGAAGPGSAQQRHRRARRAERAGRAPRQRFEQAAHTAARRCHGDGAGSSPPTFFFLFFSFLLSPRPKGRSAATALSTPRTPNHRRPRGESWLPPPEKASLLTSSATSPTSPSIFANSHLTPCSRRRPLTHGWVSPLPAAPSRVFCEETASGPARPRATPQGCRRAPSPMK